MSSTPDRKRSSTSASRASSRRLDRPPPDRLSRPGPGSSSGRISTAWTRTLLDWLACRTDLTPEQAALIDSYVPRYRLPWVDAQIDEHVWTVLAVALAESALGISFAQRAVTLRSMGPLGGLMTGAELLGDALAIGRSRYPAFDEDVAPTLEVSGLLVRFQVGRALGAPAHPVVAEATLGAWLQIMRILTGQAIEPLRVTFRHPEPAHLRICRAFFGASVSFEASANALVLPRSSLDLPVILQSGPGADTKSARPGCHDEIDDLDQRLERELLAGRCQLDSAATALGIGSRTLQRLLHSRGTTFQRVLDNLRFRLARELLVDPMRTADIGRYLAFTDDSSFRKAFRRWAGITASEWRQQAFATGADTADSRTHGGSGSTAC